MAGRVPPLGEQGVVVAETLDPVVGADLVGAGGQGLLQLGEGLDGADRDRLD